MLGKTGWGGVLPLNTKIIWRRATVAQECLLRRGPDVMALVFPLLGPCFTSAGTSSIGSS